MDPISIPWGLAGPAFKKAVEVARGSELDRLFAALGDELGETTGLSAAGLAPLREDPEILRLILEFLEEDVADEEALAGAIAPHLFQLDNTTSPSDAARIVVDAIKRNAWRARKSGVEAIVHESRRLNEERAAWTAPRFLSLEWAPRGTHSHIQRLAEGHADEAAYLEDALAQDPNQPRALARLIERPQGWLAGGSPALWAVLGHLASTHGLWDSAEAAFLAAADRPGADQAALFAKAAEMAAARGDDGRRQELLDGAREIQADHPEVLLAEARVLDDPREQLDRLEAVEPTTPGQRAALYAYRALAHLALGEIEEARACGDEARAAAPDSPLVREIAPVTALITNANKDAAVGPDWRELCEAAESYIDLRDELRGLRRHAEAVRMAARAAEAYTLAGEVGQAADVLDDVSEEELDGSDAEARRHLAKAAIWTSRLDLVRSCLADADDEAPVRLLRALAATQTSDADSFPQAIAELDELVANDDDSVAVPAAFARLNVAARLKSVAWSDDAEQKLAQVGEEIAAALLKAEHHVARGDRNAAENILLDHQQDARALEHLTDLAAQEQDFAKAAHLATTLADRAPTPSRRLLHAEMVLKAGRVNDGLAVLGVLRVDDSVPTALRERAYALASQVAWDAAQFSEVVALTKDWLQLAPGESIAAWAHVRALMHLSEYDEALAAFDECQLVARDVEEARVAASLFHRALPAQDALEKIAALSDQFDRSDEYLEGLLLVTGLGSRDDVPQELHDRLKVAFEEYPRKFPDSRMIQAFEAPETPEEIDAFFREHAGRNAEQALEMNAQVARGEAAVTVLAALAGQEVTTTWGRLGRLPIGFGDPTLDELERKDAADAIGGAAVWDPSALVVAGGLGDPLTAAIRNALPGSVIPLAVLSDADRAANHPRLPEGEELMFAGWDPVANRASITVADPDWVARDQHRADGAFALAKELREVPDTAPERPTKFDELIQQTLEQPTLKTWAASYAVAAGLTFPLYSDDRYVRVLARREGIASFGTVAVLEALVERGRLQPEELAVARRRLRASGALGIPAAQQELIDEAAAADWDITDSIRQSLLDPAAWRPVDAGIRRHVALLRAVFENDPSRFRDWVIRVLDAIHITHPREHLNVHAYLLLAAAWASESSEFVQAMIKALRTVPLILGVRSLTQDPVTAAFDLLLSFGDGQPPAFRAALFGQVIRKLGYTDQLRMIQRVQFVTEASS